MGSLNFRNKLFLVVAAALFGQHLLAGMVAAAEKRGIGGITPGPVVRYQNSWAVIIGINLYTKAPRLNYAVNDANSVLAQVQKLGFQSDKILLLLDREATKQRIEQILYGTLRRTTPEDRVFVFFAGHGVTSPLPRGGEEGYLLPVDGDPDDLQLTAISMEELSRMARRIPAKHILFAVDACYSGFAITRDANPARVDAIYLEAVTEEPAVQIITAGRKGEPVMEEEGHGLFTRRLIQGVSGLADTDQNGVITGQELATWLESRVVRDSQNRQHPQYSRLDGEGQFIFVVPRKEEAPAGVSDREQKIKEDLTRLADEAERLKREKEVLEEQRKLLAERQAFIAERAKFEEERRRSETSRLEAERLRQKAEEQRKIELAGLEAEKNRLKTEEDRLNKERAEAKREQARLETERKTPNDQAVKTSPSPELAKLPSPQPPPRPAVAVPGTAALPKYNVGDSWTVRFTDGRTQTRKIRAIERAQYVFEWGLDLLRYYDQDLVLRKQTTPEDGKDIHSYQLEQRVVNFPLSMNKTWEFQVLVSSFTRTRIYRKFIYKVVGVEPVQTPAGTFGTFKLEENSHEIECGSGISGACFDVENRAVRHWWYAPEVKSFVKLVNVKGTSLGAQEPNFELVAFELK